MFIDDFWKIELCEAMGWTEKQFEDENSIDFLLKLYYKLSADSKEMKDKTGNIKR